MKRRDSKTLDMFEIPQPQAPAAADHRIQVCHLVSDMLKGSRHEDRYAAAAAMSRIAGRDYSKFMLDAWAAESREEHNMPFYAAPALELACESTALTAWLAKMRGGQVLFGREVLAAQRGRLEQKRREVAAKIKEIDRAMGEDA